MASPFAVRERPLVRFIKTICWIAAILIGMNVLWPPIRDGRDPKWSKAEGQVLCVACSVRAYEAITGRYPPTDPIALASSLRVFTNMVDGELRQISLVNPHKMGSKGLLVDVWGNRSEVQIEPKMGIITALSPGKNRTWDGGTNDDIVITIARTDDGLPPVTSGQLREGVPDAAPSSPGSSSGLRGD